MIQGKRRLVPGLAFVLFLACAGCNHDTGNRLAAAPGDYDGFVVKRQSGHSAQLYVEGKATAASPASVSVHADVPGAAAGSPAWDLTVTALAPGKLELRDSDVSPSPVQLAAESDACFKTAQGAAPSVRLCFDGKELAIDAQGGAGDELLVVLDKRATDDRPAMETARSYTVDALVGLAQSQSFTSQSQFLAATQARLDSLQAHLNLIPHFSVNDLFGLISFSWLGLVRMAGDLVPFLIPQNWYAANAASFQSDADYHAWLVMKADSANLAEGLAYAVLRDGESQQRLSAYEGPLQYLLAQILEQEHLGVVPPHASDSIRGVLDSLKKTETLLAQTVTEENRSLAQAVGLVNPDAITGILSTGEGAAIDSPVSVDLSAVQPVVIDRSPELKQIDDLIHVAHDNAVSRRWFFWLDPAAGGVTLDPSAPASILSGAVPERELLVQKQQLQSTLLQKLANAVTELDTAVQSYGIAKDNLDAQSERYQQLLESMHLGVMVSIPDLQLAIQGQLQAEMDVVNARYAYLVAKGKLDRMALAGRYLDIESMIESGRPQPRP